MKSQTSKSEEPTLRERARTWWRRALRPPRRLKVTGTGRTYLMVTVGVGIGALNTGNNLLYLLLGLLLSVIVLSGILSERTLRDLRVERLGVEAAFAGEPAPIRWSLRRARGHAFALEVREVGVRLAGAGTLAVLPPGEARVVRGSLGPTRRGPLALSAVDVVTTWPFGLFAKSRRFDLEGELVIFPARIWAPEALPPAEHGPAGELELPRHTDGNGDLAGLRELAEGEDARRVHWLKSAAAGRLLRTEREREERHTVVLELDPSLRGSALERRCELLAAQATRLIGLGHEVGLQGDGLHLSPAPGSGQLRRVLFALGLAGHEAAGAQSRKVRA